VSGPAAQIIAAQSQPAAAPAGGYAQNLAAVAQSGFSLPWWIWFALAGLITLGAGAFVWRWSAH
jgi:hypothetical protein